MKTAVIGTGRMGRRHIQVANNLNLELTGVCDLSREALKLAAQEQLVPEDKLFTNFQNILSQKPEVVVISTTAPTHCEYTCLAAEAGVKYILCEKPMAISIAECNRMLQACKRYGTKLAINHQMRFMDQYTQPKALIQSEAFGGLASITVVAGNFGMAMNGSHYLEMFRFMTDENPNEMSAWFSNDPIPNPRGAQYEDRAGSVRATSKSGKRFYMEIGSDQGHGMLAIYAGRNGRIVVDELAGQMSFVVREDQYRSLPTTRYGMPAKETLTKLTPADAVAPTQRVLEALLAEKDFPSGDEGKTAVQALVAAYVSDEHGHLAVPIDENLPVDRKFPWA